MSDKTKIDRLKLIELCCQWLKNDEIERERFWQRTITREVEASKKRWFFNKNLTRRQAEVRLSQRIAGVPSVKDVYQDLGARVRNRVKYVHQHALRRTSIKIRIRKEFLEELKKYQ